MQLKDYRLRTVFCPGWELGIASFLATPARLMTIVLALYLPIDWRFGVPMAIATFLWERSLREDVYVRSWGTRWIFVGAPPDALYLSEEPPRSSEAMSVLVRVRLPSMAFWRPPVIDVLRMPLETEIIPILTWGGHVFAVYIEGREAFRGDLDNAVRYAAFPVDRYMIRAIGTR